MNTYIINNLNCNGNLNHVFNTDILCNVYYIFYSHRFYCARAVTLSDYFLMLQIKRNTNIRSKKICKEISFSLMKI